jgi:hypothetical protein
MGLFGAARSQVDTRDPDEAVALLGEIYCPHRLRLTGSSDGFRRTGPVAVFRVAALRPDLRHR